MSEDYNHELRARALSLPETVLRKAVDRLLEQCGREEVHQRPGSPRAEMLHTSEIYMLLGLRGPDLSALRAALDGEDDPHHGPCPGEGNR